MPFWQLFYHLVWTTKGRAPIITPQYESLVYGLIARKATALGGKVFAIGGIEDHVHLVTSIPPSISVATFVGQIKGASSAQINKTEGFPHNFRWQRDYGAFSFDRKRLPYVVRYVKEQKERHRDRALIPILERFSQPHAPETQVHEEPAIYAVDTARWEEEMRAME